MFRWIRNGQVIFVNHLMRHYYEQGAHTVIVDTGNSYKGLCELINKKTHGQDGIYFTYTDEDPICFNPFYTDDGVFDIEKRESIKTLILTLWKRYGGSDAGRGGCPFQCGKPLSGRVEKIPIWFLRSIRFTNSLAVTIVACCARRTCVKRISIWTGF